MVRIKKNIVTKGWSGKFGDDIVFRKKGDRTYAAQSPSASNVEPSEKQKAQKLRFKLAVLFAKAQMAGPVKKARYEAKSTIYLTPFNLAVADYLKVPIIDEIDIGAYFGQIADSIKVLALDNFEVTEVIVSIYDPGNALLEQGAALLDPTGTQWVYSCSTNNASLSGSKVKAVAKDYPGNATELEVLVP